jgi:hypothetical protein
MGNFILCDPRRTKARRYRKFVAIERSCKHATTTMGDGVFRGVRAEKLT